MKRYPIISYFLLTFLISWSLAFALVAPKLVSGEPIPKLDGILMFPLMLLGPLLSGIILTRITKGKEGIHDILARAKKVRIPAKWYATLLIPPAAIFTVLILLSNFIGKQFIPGFFAIGILFGIPAGFLEEIGWMGFAFPQLREKFNAISSALIVGLFWGLWHFPVIDFLGAASPHGKYWFAYWMAFIAVMMPMRMIISWVYMNTKSLFITQLLHISSTGFLVVFSPSPILPVEENTWYFAYAVLLLMVVIVIVAIYGKNLTPHSSLTYSSKTA